MWFHNWTINMSAFRTVYWFTVCSFSSLIKLLGKFVHCWYHFRMFMPQWRWFKHLNPFRNVALLSWSTHGYRAISLNLRASFWCCGFKRRWIWHLLLYLCYVIVGFFGCLCLARYLLRSKGLHNLLFVHPYSFCCLWMVRLDCSRTIWTWQGWEHSNTLMEHANFLGL